MGKKIKITKKQADMISESMRCKTKLVISESQLEMIKAFEFKNINESIRPDGSVNSASNVERSFNNSLSSEVKKGINETYESFINEVYGLREDSESKFGKLISLMENSGIIENNRIIKEKFNSDVNYLKEVITSLINEYNNGMNEYRLMEMLDNKLNENGYPAGSEFDNEAPYNQDDSLEKEVDCETDSAYPFKLTHYNENEDGLTLFTKDGELYVHMNDYYDEELFNDFCGDNLVEKINNFINYIMLNGGKISKNPYSRNSYLTKLDSNNVSELLKYYGSDEKFKSLVSSIDETTAAASSGQFSAPISTAINKSNIPSHLEETTDSTQVGGDSGTFAYDTPLNTSPNKEEEDFWLQGNKENKKITEEYLEDYSQEQRDTYKQARELYKRDKSEKNRKFFVKAAKGIGIDLPIKNGHMFEDAKTETQYPGGSMVDLDSCTKLNNNTKAQNGGCNTGDSGVVKTKKTSKSVVSNDSLYESIANKTGKTISEVKEIIAKHNKSK